MANLALLEGLLREHGCEDFKWIDPQRIVVSRWVRMKCVFGCSNYGRRAACPPNMPPVDECARFMAEYSRAALIHCVKSVAQPEDRHTWGREVNQRLLDLERAVFLAGYHKAFVLLMHVCWMCDECEPTRERCKNPKSARPAPEALAIDVFGTVRAYGYPIEVLRDTTQPMNRYAFLLVE